MPREKHEQELAVTVEEFEKNPAAVIERAFSRGSAEVVGSDPRDRIRFSTQRYDLESE